MSAKNVGATLAAIRTIRYADRQQATSYNQNTRHTKCRSELAREFCNMLENSQLKQLLQFRPDQEKLPSFLTA